MANNKRNVSTAVDSLLAGLNSKAAKPKEGEEDASNYIQELQDEIEHLRHQVASAIVKKDDRYRFRRFEMTKTSLLIPDEVTEQEVDEFGVMLSALDSSVQFWMGDWANLYIGEEDDDLERGKIYDDLAQRFGVERKTLREYASVCRILDPSVRTDALLFTHHKLIAYLPEQLKGRELEFIEWAEEQAKNGDLSKSVLQAHIAAERNKLLPKPGRTFDRKPVIKRVRRLTEIMQLSDSSRVPEKKKKQYLHDITLMRKLLDEMERKIT